MRSGYASWVLASILFYQGCTDAAESYAIRIDTPAEGAAVDQRQEISGKVTPSSAKVWVVVRPMENSDYWVQPRVTVGADGTWTVLVYFGDPGPAHKGKKYEVRAFANPAGGISEGKASDWPAAAAQTNVVHYVRR